MSLKNIHGLMAAVATVTVLGAGILPAPEVAAQQAAIDAGAEADARIVTAKGAWSPTKNYVTDDLVTSRGSTWRAKRANVNKVPGQTPTATPPLPSTAADWELFAAGFNPTGAWSGTKIYHANDLVVSNFSTWRAKRTSKGVTPVAGINWEQFAARGAPGPSSVTNGTQSAPAFSFTGDPNTGIFSPEAGKIALVEDGQLFLHNKGTDNTALGMHALEANTSGTTNTAVGHIALHSNTTGSSNTALGYNALSSNTDGGGNTAVGREALLLNNTGNSNTAVGQLALRSNTNGLNNIGLGKEAGYNPTAPLNSIFIGNAGLAADTTTIKIGTQGTQTTAFIAGIAGVTLSGGASVEIDANGQLGVTAPSSLRYKDDIQSMEDVGAMLQKLRPVTFRYKQPLPDGATPIQYGLIAEEVAEVLPAITLFDREGQPNGVKYQVLPSLLLAGYQEQQRMIAAQTEEARQQKQVIQTQAEQIASLEQRLRAIEAMVPKVTAAAVQ